MTSRARRVLSFFAGVLLLAGCTGEGWYTPRSIELSNGGLWGVPGGDSDGDGIPDSVEGGEGVDTDGDGIPDYLDTDSDNDGTLDSDEGQGDDDGDGIPNWIDDDDNTGGDDDDATGDDDDDSTGGDDDDATGDDDDSTGDDDDDDSTGDDDDDSTGDDDDSSPGDDDDDATGDDDDDSVGDDDDSFGPAMLSMTASVQDFGTVSPGTQGIATITVENTGGTGALVSLALTVTTSGTNLIWNITGGQPLFSVPANATRTRFVEFTPPAGVPAAPYTTDLELEDLDAGVLIATLTFTADTGAAGEGNCTDTVDNDGDTLVDCDDPDCGADPACNPNADFCCFAGGGPVTSTQCQSPSFVPCVCAADSWCCDAAGGWDQTCVDAYISCGATCN